MAHAAHKVTASFASTGFNGEAPDSIVYFPAGSHSISASKGGKATQVDVEITAELATLLDGQLKAALAEAEKGTASRPFIDFEHEGGRAAALPTGFRWVAEKGIVVDLEWTSAGRAAVEGREFSYFSPEWLMKDGKVAGLAQPGPIGGLVNTPAFQTIGKIAASLTSTPEQMESLIQLLKDFGLLAPDANEITEEAIAGLKEKLAPKTDVDGETSKAARVQADTDLVTARASIISLTTRAELADKALETAQAAHVKALADTEAKVDEKARFKAAEIVQAAALPAPVKLPKVEDTDTGEGITRASFERLTPSAQLAHVKAGRKII